MTSLNLSSLELDTLLNHQMDQLLLEYAEATMWQDLVLVGIERRGAVLARRLADKIHAKTGFRPACGSVDINFYRDDLSRIGHHPVLRRSELSISLDDKNVILVDDVLYTGRTVRAALDALMDWGRPGRVRLFVLVDRGGRELPIAADWVGLTVSLSTPHASVEVLVQEMDGVDAIRTRE